LSIVSKELALHPACAPEGMLTVIHTELHVLQTVAQKCIYSSQPVTSVESLKTSSSAAVLPTFYAPGE